MNKEPQELGEVIADLKLIKEAVSRSDGIIRFIDIRGALKIVLLATGLMIALFSVLFYYLIEYYGSFTAVPLNIRTILFFLIGLTLFIIGYLKISNFLRSARGIRGDMTLNSFFDEFYTPRLIALQLPFMIVIVLAIIFLCSNGLLIYITPVLAILFGLLFVSFITLFYLKELYFLSVWLIATGLLTLFIAVTLHPLAVLGLTFSAGFVLASLLLYLDLPGQKRKQQ